MISITSSSDFHAWLDSQHPHQAGTCGDRLSFLLLANGGPRVTGWGCMSWSGPGGHQQGLEQEEAMELLYLTGFLDGLESTGLVGAVYDILVVRVKEYAKQWAQKDEPAPVEGTPP